MPDRHIFWTIFLECINNWILHSPNLPTVDTLPQLVATHKDFSPELQDMIYRTLEDQTRIGWDNALKGILAQGWTQIAKYGNQPIQEATRRIQDALKRLYNRNMNMWKGRNESLHGASETELTRIYTMDSAAIRYYHSRPHLLAACDRHYCERPILSILRGSPSTRRR